MLPSVQDNQSKPEGKDMTDQQLLETPDVDLSSGLYYRKYKLQQAKSGMKGAGINMVPVDEVYELYVYYSDLKGKPLSGNQLTKAMRAEGQKISNERGKLLASEFEIRYLGALSDLDNKQLGG